MIEQIKLVEARPREVEATLAERGTAIKKNKKLCVLEDGREYECWVSSSGKRQYSIELRCLETGEGYTYAVCPQFFIVDAAPLLWPVRSRKVLLVAPSPTCLFDGETPSVFSLCHPLDEIKPVAAYADSIELAQLKEDAMCPCCFVTQQTHGSLVGCCEFTDSNNGTTHVLAVMHNATQQCHRVYSLEKRSCCGDNHRNKSAKHRREEDEIAERLRGVSAAALAEIIPDVAIGPTTSTTTPVYAEAPGSSPTWTTNAFVVCARGAANLCLFKKDSRMVDVVPVWPKAGGSAKHIACDTATYIACRGAWEGMRLLITGTKTGVLSVYYGTERIAECGGVCKGSNSSSSSSRKLIELETIYAGPRMREVLVATVSQGGSKEEEEEEEERGPAAMEVEIDGQLQQEQYVCSVRCLPQAELAVAITQGLEEALPTKLVCEVLRGYNDRLNCNNTSKTSEVLTVANDMGDWGLFADALEGAMLLPPSLSQGQGTLPSTQQESDWDILVRSAYNYDARRDASLHGVWVGTKTQPLPTETPADSARGLRWDRRAVQAAANVMHIVYEDSKLSTLLGSARAQLARTLTRVCRALGWVAHTDHYARDFPAELMRPGPVGEASADEPAPLSVYGLLRDLLDGHPAEFQELRAARRIGRIVPLYAKVLSVPEEGFEEAAGELLERDWMSRDAIDEIPFGAALILRELCVLYKAAPPATWPAAVYRVIGRADLAAQRMHCEEEEADDEHEREGGRWSENRERGHSATATAGMGALQDGFIPGLFQSTTAPLPPLSHMRRRPHTKNGTRRPGVYNNNDGAQNEQDNEEDGDEDDASNSGRKEVFTGAECDEQIVYMLFPSDKRVMAVQEMLQSSERVVVPVESPSTEELLREQQNILTKLYTRTLALPVGRGAFALSLDKHPQTASGTGTLVSEREDSGRHTRFPAFMRDGRNLSGQDVTCENRLDEREERWPRFHNGVATALRIASGATYTASLSVAEAGTDDSSNSASGDAAAAEAGYVLGLWLQGHFPADLKAETLGLLTRRHLLTKMAVLLGLSVANAGTMDEKAVKTLYLHAPFLRASPTAQIGISHKAAAAADATKSNPMLVATALLGTGLVYRGTAHRLPAEILLNELAVQPRVRNTRNPEAYALAAGLGLGLVGLGRGDASELRDLRLLDVLAGLIAGGRERPEVSQLHEVERVAALNSLQPVCVLHNGLVNTPVTAPAALAAVTLLFLRTNNPVAARLLRSPAAPADLEAQPPHLLCLRELARHLICWDSVGATQDWVEAQIPAFARQDTAQDHTPSSCYVSAQLAITAGACMGIGYRYAGSADEVARCTLLGYLKHFIGLREKLVAAALATTTTSAAAATATSPHSAVPVRERCLRAQIEAHIDNVAIALSLVMAGTGDLECLRCFRALHLNYGSSSNNISNDDDTIEKVSYGDHLARHMALGFLFLGGGMLTFANTLEGIAALFCALYPVWPTAPGDNTYHLQIFRHLYVLAAESRLLVPCDIDTMRPCYLPVTVTDAATGASYTKTTPFALPGGNARYTAAVASQRYLSAEFVSPEARSTKENENSSSGNNNKLRLVRSGKSPRSAPFVMFVKRKAGFLPYADDPSGDKSLNIDASAAMAVPWDTADEKQGQGQGRDEQVGLLQAFNNDKAMQAFIRLLALGGNGSSTPQFYYKAAVSCLSEEKGELLPIVLALWHHTMHARITPEAACNVLLLKSARSCVLDPLLVSSADLCLREKFSRPRVRAFIKKYILEGVVVAEEAKEDEMELFAAAMQYLEIPHYGTVCKLRALLREQAPRTPGGLFKVLRQVGLTPSAVVNLINILKE